MKSFALFFILLLSLNSQSAVWEVKNQWDELFEDEFSEWVEKEWTQGIFKKGILKDLETDCADASYTMRALFSYLHQLPFQVTTGDGEILTESSDQFDSFKKQDERFRRFLKFVYNVTGTSTLSLDTFPVALNRKSFRPGILYVSPGKHSYQIIEVGDDGVPYLLSSTEPKENRILNLIHSFPFFRPESKRFLDGFRAFRWPQEMKMPVQKISRARFDQFEIPGHVLEFAESARKKVALRPETLPDKIKRSLQNLCYFSRERAHIVVSGYLQRLKTKNQCLSGDDFEEYSTPTRDLRLKDFFLYVRNLRSHPEWYEMSEQDRKNLASVFVPNVPSAYCEVQTGVATKPILTLNEIWKALEAGRLSSNPNESILARWGQEPLKNTCN